MSGADFLVLLPLICLGYGAVVVLLVGAFWRSHAVIVTLTLAALVACVLTSWQAVGLVPRQVSPLLRLDVFALAYLVLFAVGAIAVTAFSWEYLAGSARDKSRFYSLLLISVAGMGLLASSGHFAAFLLGLETLSVSLYGLIGFTLRRPQSLEASLKYLVLAGVSLSFLLMGMALIYFEFGTMEFSMLAARLGASAAPPYLVLLGLGLVLVGFGFKLALVPFHSWAPDVYEGAPAPITALIATGSKAAVLALLVRFSALLMQGGGSLALLLTLLAIITMFGGNLLALLQGNLKRLLAYSSVAHMGYLLIPLLAGPAAGAASVGCGSAATSPPAGGLVMPCGHDAIWFYLVCYFVASLGAFGVICALAADGRELTELDQYRGLGFRRPLLGAALGLMMLSLAGIPLTAGFMAKLYIFMAAARSGLWLLLVVGLVNSGVAAYYYLRVLIAVYSPVEEPDPSWPRTRAASGLTLCVLSALVLILGLLPGPLIRHAETTSRRATAGAAALQRPFSSDKGKELLSGLRRGAEGAQHR
ncbi:MAG: NADH-quinone oxidoreductase subunit N [Armatimonadota bacterium]